MVSNAIFVYPGQGAQYPGMGKDLYDSSAAVKALFEQASDASGKDMKKLLFEGSADDLKATDVTQIGITLVNLSAKAVLEEQGVSSVAAAGFSLGEFAALVDAGVVSSEDIFPLVLKRGEAMQAACESSGGTGMAAVLGMTPEDLTSALEAAGRDDVFAANFNSPIQVVISGLVSGIEAITPALKDAGAKRIIPLKVAGAFHSPYMNSAKEAFAEVLKDINFSDPVKPLYSNVTGNQISSGNEAKELCPLQIISPVRWTEIEKELAALNAGAVLETGPGKVLCGLWAKSGNADLNCFPAGTTADIDNLKELS